MEEYVTGDSPVLCEEAGDVAAAVAHFAHTRLVLNKGAPRQDGVLVGTQRTDPCGVQALKLVKLMGECMDLRKLVTHPGVTNERADALKKLRASAVLSGALHAYVCA